MAMAILTTVPKLSMVTKLTKVDSVASDHGGGFMVLHHRRRRRRSIPRTSFVHLSHSRQERDKGGEVNNECDGEDDCNK